MALTTLDLSTLSDIADGAHTVKVKAKASGYRDSEFSNEVSYTKSSGYTITFDQQFIKVASFDPTYVKVNTPPNSADDYTIRTWDYPGISGPNPVSGVTKLYVWGYAYINTAGETVYLKYSPYNNAVEIPISSDGTFTIVSRGND